MVQFQKLKRKPFLILYGHNLHRQQQQLSEFLMCYQQFASHAYCGAAGPVSKMASQQEKAFCLLRFEAFRSVITVQREFCARFRKDAPCRNNKTRWNRQFVETGCSCKGKSPGRPRVFDDNIERVREAFLRSPRKSVARASRELDMPNITVWKVRNKFLVNFRNRTIILCIPCLRNSQVSVCSSTSPASSKMWHYKKTLKQIKEGQPENTLRSFTPKLNQRTRASNP